MFNNHNILTNDINENSISQQLFNINPRREPQPQYPDIPMNTFDAVPSVSPVTPSPSPALTSAESLFKHHQNVHHGNQQQPQQQQHQQQQSIVPQGLAHSSSHPLSHPAPTSYSHSLKHSDFHHDLHQLQQPPFTPMLNGNMPSNIQSYIPFPTTHSKQSYGYYQSHQPHPSSLYGATSTNSVPAPPIPSLQIPHIPQIGQIPMNMNVSFNSRQQPAIYITIGCINNNQDVHHHHHHYHHHHHHHHYHVDNDNNNNYDNITE